MRAVSSGTGGSGGCGRSDIVDLRAGHPPYIAPHPGAPTSPTVSDPLAVRDSDGPTCAPRARPWRSRRTGTVRRRVDRGGSPTSRAAPAAVGALDEPPRLRPARRPPAAPATGSAAAARRPCGGDRLLLEGNAGHGRTMRPDEAAANRPPSGRSEATSCVAIRWPRAAEAAPPDRKSVG